MPKMKTNKSRIQALPRVRFGPRSSLQGGRQPPDAGKSRKRIRRARNNDMVDKTLQRKIKRLIPYG